MSPGRTLAGCGFSDKRLPLRKKIATLAGFEAEVAYETLVRAVDLPFEIMGKGLDLLIIGRPTRLPHGIEAQRMRGQHDILRGGRRG